MAPVGGSGGGAVVLRAPDWLLEAFQSSPARSSMAGRQCVDERELEIVSEGDPWTGAERLSYGGGAAPIKRQATRNDFTGGR